MPIEPDVHAIAATTHGRVLVRRAAAPRGILAGFHGYLENAEIQLARLESIPGAQRWTLVSVQALHRVYRGRTHEVVASWMTRQDRELAIDDNVAYVAAAVRAGAGEARLPVVYAGFSQGGQMACRAAALGDARSAGIICVGADVPPDLFADRATRIPPVLLARGATDPWYTAAKHDADLAALREHGARVETLVYAGAHEWTAEVGAAVARFLERRA